jgi:hypothetical protein
MLFALFTGCNDTNSPDGLARAFVDAYYVEYDVDRAIALSDGAATLRLKEEKDLIDEARAKTAIAQSRSRTYYGDPTKREVGGELVHYTFELEIRQGSNDMRRTAVIMIAKRNDLWKVIGFREAGEGGAGPENRATGATDSNSVRTSTRGL